MEHFGKILLLAATTSLTIALGCSTSKPDSATTASASRTLSCLNLDLTHGFQTNEQFRLAIHCLNASNQYPHFASYVGGFRGEDEITALREFANQVLEVENLTTIVDLFGRWEARVGATNLEEFGQRLEPIFSENIWKSIFDDLKTMDLGGADLWTGLRGLQFLATQLANPSQAETFRTGMIRLISNPHFETFQDQLGSSLEIEDSSGELLIVDALQELGAYAVNGSLQMLLDSMGELIHAKSFETFLTNLRTTDIVQVWNLLEPREGTFGSLVKTIHRTNRLIACGDESWLKLADNGAREVILRWTQGRLGITKEIERKKLPFQQCGLSAEDLRSLATFENRQASRDAIALKGWITIWIQNGEEMKLIQFLSALGDMDTPALYRWLDKGIHSNLLSSTVGSYLALRQDLPDFLPKFELSLPDSFFPNSALQWSHWTQNRNQSALSKSIHEFADAQSPIRRLPKLLLPMLAPSTFSTFRALVLTLWDFKSIPLSVAQLALSVGKSNISDYFTSNPPSPIDLIEGIRLISLLSSSYRLSNSLKSHK